MKEKDKRRELVSELGRVFLKTKALRIGNYTTSDGRKTPYYIDMRPTLSFPPAVSLVIECLEYDLRQIQSTNPECICGIPLTGLIFSSILAFKLGNFSDLSSQRRDGTQNFRSAQTGNKVVIVDDVSETGLSIVPAALAIRANGGIVTDALTIIDRSEGARETLAKHGIDLRAFTTTHELAKTLRENLALSDDEIELVESG